MTWHDIRTKSIPYLEAKGVPDATVAVECLIGRLLKVSRGGLIPVLSREADDLRLQAMRRGLARLVAGEPLQYVIGEWDFRSLTLGCDRRALIPRPETEELVTRVLRHLKDHATDDPSADPPVIVDVGTGTGAIILSLAKEFPGRAAFIGTDVSADAIDLAKSNAVRCGLADRVKFAVADGLDDFDEPESLDVIVSNPPYIESATVDTLDPCVRDHEPRLALDGGESGLDFYDRYLADALNLLKPGGAVFFEIGETQGEALRTRMSDYGFSEIRIEKDYAGHDRYASARLLD